MNNAIYIRQQFKELSASKLVKKDIDEMAIRIVDAIKNGGTRRTAARAAGISLKLLEKWEEVGENVLTDLIEAVDREYTLHERNCYLLYQLLSDAEAQLQLELAQQALDKDSASSASNALAYLKMRFAEDFEKKQQVNNGQSIEINYISAEK